MKTHFLFPNHLKKIGWILFIPSLITILISSIFSISIEGYLEFPVIAIYQESIGYKPSFFEIIRDDIAFEIVLICLIIGGILVGFSRLKNEDEMISKIRYESLVWATYINYTLIILFTFFIYGLPFMNVIIFNLFTLLLFFIIRFHYIIYKLNLISNDEE